MCRMKRATAASLTILALLCCISSFAAVRQVCQTSTRNGLKKMFAGSLLNRKRSSGRQLTTDAGRDAFVTRFWNARNPSPGATVNRFKDEHYRRVAYANQHFAAAVEGDLSDRGRAYIVYGSPLRLNATEKLVRGERYPSEVWAYSDKLFEFVDQCRCGNFTLYGTWPTTDTR